MWLPAAPTPILRADMPPAAEACILSENTARLYELVAKSDYRGLGAIDCMQDRNACATNTRRLGDHKYQEGYFLNRPKFWSI